MQHRASWRSVTAIPFPSVPTPPTKQQRGKKHSTSIKVAHMQEPPKSLFSLVSFPFSHMHSLARSQIASDSHCHADCLSVDKELEGRERHYSLFSPPPHASPLCALSVASRASFSSSVFAEATKVFKNASSICAFALSPRELAEAEDEEESPLEAASFFSRFRLSFSAFSFSERALAYSFAARLKTFPISINPSARVLRTWSLSAMSFTNFFAAVRTVASMSIADMCHPVCRKVARLFSISLISASVGPSRFFFFPFLEGDSGRE
mmetsp:Transcript_24116/g.47367  ORF Transcript_24116/g.47367 Transcript_24116/m.47367 type:complete len:265 (-) Transcript_24116:124-918(-)